MTQKGRKESPSDSNRQATAPKAWSGANPITQRATTPNQSKGNTSQSKSTPTSKMTSSRDQTLSDKHNYDRLRFLFGGSVGLQVVLTTNSGDKFEGVFAGFSGATNASKIALKMTKKVPHTPITQPNGISSWEAAFAGSSPDHAMTFDLKDMADMTIPEYSLPELSRQTNGASTSFQTDADISGNANRGERLLQKWVPEANDSTDFSLESGSATGWDQFATHQKMTGGHSTYTEETYTTTIDRSAPDYKKREAEAARIAREIESQQSTNAHVREERGHAVENDPGDEEDKYSGVRRDQQNFIPLPTGNANRYMPPAMRAPTSQATASGAPIDPAIISSQLARPVVPPSRSSNQAAPATAATTATAPQTRAISMMQSKNDEPAPIEKHLDLSKLTANGTVPKSLLSKQGSSLSPSRQPDPEAPSQGVENKVLDQFRQFANAERARLAEKKRVQASQDRTAKINDLVRFSKTFKLKTPIPNDLVGILAKDPKKQETIMDKAQKDSEGLKTQPSTAANLASSSTGMPPVPKFDKSQIPPPIPERNTFNSSRASYAKGSLGRGARPLGQQLPFTQSGVPLAPRGSKNGAIPTPIPLPDIRSNQTTAATSGVSSPRGIDTPTSAVSTKFNVRALEFRPTAPSFNPSNASVSAASPSPIARTASIARSASPSSFFGQKRPKGSSERLDVTKSFNPISRMKEEVKTEMEKKAEGPARDFKANGGIPNAYHTQPIWVVAEDNQEKAWDDVFNKPAVSASPAINRTGFHQAVPFHGQMQHMAGAPHMAPNVTPQHVHHGGPQFQPQIEGMHGSSAPFASPNMTPRHTYASPMGHPAQVAYGHQSYFGGAQGQMAMRPQYTNAAMMHNQHGGHMIAPMMAQQQSSGPYMGLQNQAHPMYSPGPAHVFPQQQNGYPSPGRMQAPMMMQQHSQQGYTGNPPMMYSGNHPAMYGQQPQMGRGYGGQTPYGSSPHQPHQMNQRAMSSGYMKGGMPQMGGNMNVNGGPPANAPQQPAAYGQMGLAEEGK
ncbi:poly(A)-binding protein binding protein [Knufia obscura]|uniref:Poly(A)-binding protein binding protein n=1 Tax=Knufia obscura TaxID=1635080 RepID=A0ABR0RCJ5_9EURO|nr:poly(A)-binding protein binding protein [Knufia obscura]